MNNGQTEAENEILELTKKLWSKVSALEKMHPSELPDVANAIHVIQRIIAMRCMRRLYPAFWFSYSSDFVDL